MTKVLHIGYQHRFDDNRIVLKECCTLNTIPDMDLTYVTSERKGYFSGIIDGVTIRTLPVNKRRGFRLLKYIRDVKQLICEEKPDIIHIHEFVLYPLVKTAIRMNAKVVLDLHENDVYDMSEKIGRKYGSYLETFVRRLLLVYERYYVLKSNNVISVTPQIINRISKYNVSTTLIANFPKIEDSDSFEGHSFDSFRTVLHRLCFAGGISPVWGHDCILKAIERIDGKIEYFLAGNCAEEYLLVLENYSSWVKTKYFGVITHQEVIDTIYKQCGIGMALLSCKGEWLEKEGTLGNTKIFEFMQFGIPVIATNFSIWKEIIEKNDCGICVDPYDEDEVKNAISWLQNNPKRAYEMGNNGKKAIKFTYNWENEAKKLKELYKRLM